MPLINGSDSDPDPARQPGGNSSPSCRDEGLTDGPCVLQFRLYTKKVYKKKKLVFVAGKLFVLDGLLRRLKEEGHRVLIYSQMTKMIDLLEEFMSHR